MILTLEHSSEVLRDNPLGDPHIRRFPVYVPPDYDNSPARTYPVIFGLTGFTGSGWSYLHKRFLMPTFEELLDELILKRGMPGVIYVMPDALTSLGGSQYVNSTAVGRYEDYIVKELVPYIDQKFRTTGQRGCVGGSSGGIGSFTLAAKFPEIFQGFADHCGDSAFEYCYLSDVPKFTLAFEKYDFKVENFLAQMVEVQPKDANFQCLLNLIAMAACYSPNPAIKPHGFELPFDPRTGAIIPEIWAKWLSHDPVRMASRYADNLKKLKFAFIDCGRRDQFNLYLGSRQLSQELKRLGVTHLYEEYDSDHFLLRREQKKKSIPMLVKALS